MNINRQQTLESTRSSCSSQSCSLSIEFSDLRRVSSSFKDSDEDEDSDEDSDEDEDEGLLEMGGGWEAITDSRIVQREIQRISSL